jgi:hypothetical protein
MGFRRWFRPPRHLVVLFLTVTVVPAVALVWLGWQMVTQERNHAVEGVDESADRPASLAHERRDADCAEHQAGQQDDEREEADQKTTFLLHARCRPVAGGFVKTRSSQATAGCDRILTEA